MDPFEARLQFSRMLAAVQPATQVLMKCSSFALRNYEYQDDLHSCILEVLETSDLNSRLNMMNFIDTLVSQSKKSFSKNPSQSKLYPYVGNIEKDLPTIISKVVPANKYGLYNLRMAADILRTICVQLDYDESKIKEYEEQLKVDLLSDDVKALIEAEVEKKRQRQITTESNRNEKTEEILFEETSLEINLGKAQAHFEPMGVNSVRPGIEGAWQILIDRKRLSQYISYRNQLLDDNLVDNDQDKNAPFSNNGTGKRLELTREQMLARMEADRERHKKAKESLWIVERGPSSKVDKIEFQKLWDKYGPLTDDDLKELSELSDIAHQSYSF